MEKTCITTGTDDSSGFLANRVNNILFNENKVDYIRRYIMMFKRKEDNFDIYRKVEAMHRRGCSTDEISNNLRLSKIEILDITQKIFAMDKKLNRI